ncbi:MAG TPA: Hpt domain-containing protein [Thermoanaerobaculia bacterium]|nr:Hpt domain-containing protein [Thermoanaerobaculia bacterium]
MRKQGMAAAENENERVRGILEGLRRSFLAGTPQRLNAIAASITALAREPASRESLDRLRLHFHNLAGLAGMHGMAEVTDLGRCAERTCQRLLETGEAASEEDLDRWRTVLDRFTALFAAASGSIAPLRSPAAMTVHWGS